MNTLFIHNFLYRLRPAKLAAFLKRVFGVKRRFFETPRGTFWLDPVSNLGNALINGRDYEVELAVYLENVLEPGNCFLDIGANEGYFSVIAGKIVGGTGQVVIIEPQSRLKHVIEKNLKANCDTPFEIYPLAVSDANGRVDIHLSTSINTGSSGLGENVPCDAKESVEMVTLDALLSKIERKTIDLMKMDIESFEYEAILGSRAFLQEKRIRKMAIEFHQPMLRNRGKDLEAIPKALSAAGYNVRPMAGYLIAEL